MISLQFLAPPVLGAFIGYMTNYVAIKMLFRPLKAWRVLGIRVPMTPGVIPSKRNQLAENIGEMVGAHLLTSADVSKAIAGEKFQQDLKELIESRLDVLLNKDLGPLSTIIPHRFQTYFRASIRVLRLRFLTAMHGYLDSSQFADTIKNAVDSQATTFLKKNLKDIFPEDSRANFYTYLEVKSVEFLGSPEVNQWISTLIQKKLKEFQTENRSLNDLIPEEITELVLDRLEQEVPGLLDKFGHLIQEPEMRAKIVETITTAIGNFINSLGPIAAMMGGFIKPETIHTKVNEYLNEKSDDISVWLRDEAVQQRVTTIFREKASHFMEMPCSTLLSKIDPAKIEEISLDISKQVAIILAKPSTAKALTAILKETFTAQLDKPLLQTLSELFGTQGIAKGRQWAASEITAIFRSSATKQVIHNLIVELIEKKLLAKPVGPLADLIPKKIQESFADYLLSQISEILIREVPGLVDSLNIRSMVSRKVDSLDLLRLEGLLMSIMEEQFKYINLFGALLGFFIGLLNLVVLSL
ncbi:MAG: DUF445 family protein [Desulfobulbaceae bacterium]|uniref:DUF445 family protein n=1 Tax=Candidatus Desulfobia pelagia TaxID=2841692 RepID=A0A8J6NBF2_9BACT|nr:DUF445 family protein [Candidatus Desulfobia pelagia]